MRLAARFPLLLVASLLGAVSAAPAAEPSPILVRYSWDDGNVEAGPDTFSVYRNGRSSVQLSNSFRASGTQSVEFRDVAGDGDFPELLGYFPERRDGWLIVHFALLVTDPNEELNIALAGPQRFVLGRDGISLWLFTRDGNLVQMTDSIPKRLVSLKPFTWYAIDADLDLAAGRYNLQIFEEGSDKAVVSLLGQPNAASQPGSAVSLLSFVGSPGLDRSNVVYYLDDVVVASSREVALPPFVAPGRRQFLADQQAEETPAEEATENSATEASKAPDTAVLERRGDEAFRRRSLPEAQQLYEEALQTAKQPSTLFLKLSDVAFLRGDLATEKALREKIFGSLDPR